MRPVLVVCVLITVSAAFSTHAADVVTPAQFWLGGDVNLGLHPTATLQPLQDVLHGAPGFVNLEGPVTDHLPSGKGVRLGNAPSGLAPLQQAGVRVVGVDNNHALDSGERGLAQTLSSVEKSGLQPAGAGRTAVLLVGDTRLAITAHDLTHGVPPTLQADLTSSKTHGDILIATFHVTADTGYLPPRELTAAVDIALKAGASVVAAHGSHQVGPVEKRGDAVIAYGLGNVAFACDCTQEKDAILLRLNFAGRALHDVEVLPIEAGLNGGKAQRAADPRAILELLQAIGSRGLRVDSASGRGFL